MELILKRYRVDNVYKSDVHYKLERNGQIMRCKESIEEPEAASLLLFHAVHRAIDNDNDILIAKLQIKYNALIGNLDSIQQEDLEKILKKYYSNNFNYSKCKHNGCQILLFQSAHQIVKCNDFHFDYVSIFESYFDWYIK